MTQFISLKQFAVENGTTGFQALKDALYTKTHADGRTEEVQGVKALGRTNICLALSSKLAGKSPAELASQAGNLSVGIQEYVDKDNNPRKSYILCTSGEREGIGAVAALVF